MVLLPTHTHHNKPREEKKEKTKKTQKLYPIQNTWQLTPAMSAIF